MPRRPIERDTVAELPSGACLSLSLRIPPATIVGFYAHQCEGVPPVDLAEPACGCAAFCAASLSFTLAR